MFERFTKDARDVVTGSSEHAQRAGADAVTEEHLLLALLDQEGRAPPSLSRPWGSRTDGSRWRRRSRT